MKKLLILSIVSLLLSCDNNSMGNQQTKQEVKDEGQIELKEPKPVTNITHSISGNIVTVNFEHDGIDLKEIHVSIGCTNGYASIQKEYLKLDKDAREFSFDNAELNAKISCTHTPCKEIFAGIHVVYDSKFNNPSKYYEPSMLTTPFSIDY
jgi:hypothetical protein